MSGLMTQGTEHLKDLEWGLAQKIKNSYDDTVRNRLAELSNSRWSTHQVVQYGELSYERHHFPLYLVKVGDWKDQNKPKVIVTGGVHGYEAGGIYGALHFLENIADSYTKFFDILVYPCVSPSAYEIDSRWNMKMQDPNRGFKSDSDVQECRQFLKSLENINRKFELTIDLHETPPEDLIIMKQQGSASGVDLSSFPDSFYLLEDCPNIELRLGSRITQAVGKLVPVCKSNKIIGFDSKDGVVTEFPALKNLCMTYLRSAGWTNQAFTTETYTEGLTMSERVNVQIAVIQTALDCAKERLFA